MTPEAEIFHFSKHLFWVIVYEFLILQRNAPFLRTGGVSHVLSPVFCSESVLELSIMPKDEDVLQLVSA